MAQAYVCDICNGYFIKQYKDFKELHTEKKEVPGSYSLWNFSLFISIEGGIRHMTHDDRDICPKCVINLFTKAIKIIEKEI